MWLHDFFPVWEELVPVRDLNMVGKDMIENWDMLED